MENLKNYTIGLDIGIGSVGWAVLDNDKGRVRDFGARIFESGENVKDRERDSQKRRSYRSQRRQVRRRHHRKERLKHLFNKLQICTNDSLMNWYENGQAIRNKIEKLSLQEKFRSSDLFTLRTIALDYMLNGEELLAVLLHICNHRGYRPFYEEDEELQKSANKEDKKLMQGKSKVEALMKAGGYRTTAEMFSVDKEFENPDKNFKNFSYVRNKNDRESHYLTLRSQNEDEVKRILEKQLFFHPILNTEIMVSERGKLVTTKVIDRIYEIIFSQRDFEEGPDVRNNYKGQKYGNFVDTIGGCAFYRNEKRGIRCSVIGDLFATTNLLSQYTYVNEATGEIIMPKDAADELVMFIIFNGGISLKAFKQILKKHNTTVNTKIDSKDTFSKCNKYIHKIKNIIEGSGLIWNDFAAENQLDISHLSKLGILSKILAENITPERREKALKKLDFINDLTIKLLKKEKFGGTSSASDRFMIDAIEAFSNGENYGNFQARKIEERFISTSVEKTDKLPFINDEDMIKNPVVFRSLNETRKIVNAIITEYGTPSGINVEIASEVNKSFKGRDEISKKNWENEKQNDRYRDIIAGLKHCNVTSVSSKDIERYKLYEQQEQKCLYSGDIINIENLFSNAYEVDHIIPYSLILDNSIQNKCLVTRRANQAKGQRTPFQFFRETNNYSGEKEYITRINGLFRGEKSGLKISTTKYQYLTLDSIFSEEGQATLSQWKSRNLNDTRYISKYVVNMLKMIKMKNDGDVLPVKGGLTARFRKWWLEDGKSTIECFKQVENDLLHNRKRMRELEINFKDNQVELLKEKEIIFATYIEFMKDKYGFEETYAKELFFNNLYRKNRENTHLHHGIDAILIGALSKKYIELGSDNAKLREIFNNNNKQKTKEYFDYLSLCKSKMSKYYHMSEYEVERLLTNPTQIPCRFEKIKDEVLVRSIDRNEELFRKLCLELYQDDEFVKKLRMPLISAKPERKFTGAMTSDMARKIDDPKLNKPLKKNISETNYSLLPANKYYCTEVFTDDQDNSRIRGIRFVDIVKENKKLRIIAPLPEGYKEHVMFLFTNDFIELVDKNGKIKISGYFRFSTVLSSGQQQISISNLNIPVSFNNCKSTLGKSDFIRRYNIDILGRKGSEVKCGEPLLLMQQKE